MKIITCASFYGSGSSALTDLVAEYDNVKDLSDFEFRFLHDIDGIRDLEYHLVENHNRHNSGHALKRFSRVAKFNSGDLFSRRYSGFIDKDLYLNATQEYINALTDFKYKGWWFFDLFDKGAKVYNLYQIFNHLFRKIPVDGLKILKNEETLCTHPSEERFLNATRKYISDLLCAMNEEDKEFIEIDQLLPSSNINQYLKYFEDEIFVFIVDRDPRDVYCLGKYYWKDGTSPKDADNFCKWFRYARQAGNPIKEKDNDKIIKLKFEDMIFHYVDTVAYVERVTGLNDRNHKLKYQKFNPRRSMVNAGVWKKHIDDPAIRVIEDELSEYLYDFADVDTSNIPGVEESNATVF